MHFPSALCQLWKGVQRKIQDKKDFIYTVCCKSLLWPVLLIRNCFAFIKCYSWDVQGKCQQNKLWSFHSTLDRWPISSSICLIFLFFMPLNCTFRSILMTGLLKQSCRNIYIYLCIHQGFAFKWWVFTSHVNDRQVRPTSVASCKKSTWYNFLLQTLIFPARVHHGDG